MENNNREYEEIITAFTSLANQHEDIRTVIIIGSRARVIGTADQWSDLDFVIFSTNPDYYLGTIDWLDDIGMHWLTFVEDTFIGSKERRVLFEGGLDVDFNFIPVALCNQLMNMQEVQRIFNNGYHILIDKDNLFKDIKLEQNEVSHNALPAENEFLNLVNDFWYHFVWATKKLLRGELWIAKSNVDGYLKRLLLTMTEWHAKAENGQSYPVWHDGRFFDKWADKRIVEGLTEGYAYYNKQDIFRALIKTIDLFSMVAKEVSEKLAYQYPYLAEEKAKEWVKDNWKY